MTSTPTLPPHTVPHIKLNDAHQIPAIGFGTGTAHYGKECTEHVLSALNVGYRYLDGAEQYRNGASVREGFQQWGGKRDEVYILTKCGMDGVREGANHPRKVLEALLYELDLPYVDMYLIHNPFYPAPMSLPEAWKVMEELKNEGLTRSIGVSNFREEDLLEMESHWTIPPAVNQIEIHPYVFHAPNVERLLNLHHKHNITTQAYGPLAPLARFTGGPVDEVVAKIAKQRNATESQVLLTWARQHTHGVIVTTSRNAERQKEQLDSLQAVPHLTDEEMNAIRDAGRGWFRRHGQNKVWDAAKP